MDHMILMKMSEFKINVRTANLSVTNPKICRFLVCHLGYKRLNCVLQ